VTEIAHCAVPVASHFHTKLASRARTNADQFTSKLHKSLSNNQAVQN